MSCPTCNHTMQNLGAEGQRIFYCPRCGTLKEYCGDFFRIELPYWLRQALSLHDLKRQANAVTHTETAVRLIITQGDGEPQIDFHIYDRNGKRVI